MDYITEFLLYLESMETSRIIVERNRNFIVILIKKNEFMKFLGKWMDLEGIILSEVTQSQKNSNEMYSLISGY